MTCDDFRGGLAIRVLTVVFCVGFIIFLSCAATIPNKPVGTFAILGMSCACLIVTIALGFLYKPRQYEEVPQLNPEELL